MAWVAFVLTLAAGWFVAALSVRSVLGRFALAALFGPGLASLLFFLLILAGAVSTATVWTMLVLLTTGAAIAWWKLKPIPSPSRSASNTFPWTGALLFAAACSVAVFLSRFVSNAHSLPAGEWDALSIWTLRASQLAGGEEIWRRAVSLEVGGYPTHMTRPGYPLFLSGFVALQWAAAGQLNSHAPLAASLIFPLASMALMAASLAQSKSTALGALACVLLVVSRDFTTQAAWQLADLPLGLAFLAAIVLLDQAQRTVAAPCRLLFAAGLAIGLAPWIKNEGWPFAIAALPVAAWRFGLERSRCLLAGAAPGLLVTIALKQVAQGLEDTFPRTFAQAWLHVSDPVRWWQALMGFGRSLAGAGPLWAHPVVLLAVLAFVLGVARSEERRAKLWLGVPIVAVVASDFGVYLLTTYDLPWHISTSVDRLVVQVWAPLLWFVFSMLRPPEEYFETSQ